ncbi:LOW QUALITY PROTEIN: hypothetical protein HID58_094753 [Brassica napus]|uniref:Uncharacterized protein n=1 Tax=Brassica napus TaxID=3708 RepID=A0ABQ7X8M1_BRANA|nr:LOW QUALITY PROTEIN: hypothetical protein HID58_094753 [Brassica napus]
MYLSCQLQEIKMEHVVDVSKTMRQEPQSMGKPVVKARNCQVMLELVIAELRAGDYRSRMPDAAAKKRIENKYFELVEKRFYQWSTDKRTGVAVDQSTGQIDMMQTWWADRIAEYGNKGNFVLQKKPLPFKDLLDQIFGEHDVEQDERYSPHMLGQHIQQIQPLCLAMMTRVEQIADVTNDQGSQPPTRRTSARRPPRRRSSFETQVESGFQRVIDTRQDILEELRSRKVQKLSYGDATAVLEKLPIEQLGVNKLLKNEVDVREAFIKMESQDIKIRYLESLVGIDRYGNPCTHVDLLMTSQNLFQNVGMTGTSSMGTETVRTDFMGLLGMHSSELEESTKNAARVVHIHDDGSDAEKLDLRIIYLLSRGTENLEEDELVELMLLEEEEFMQRYMHPILNNNFCKNPTNNVWGNAIMSTPRNQNGARRGRKSNNEARTTIDGKPVVKARNCQVMLELVIAELRAGDYRSRMPDAAAKKRIENKYFELVGEKICWDPEITNKIGYLRKLWSINGQLIKRTGVAVDQSTGQIDMMQTWWADRIAVSLYAYTINYVLIKNLVTYIFMENLLACCKKKPLPFKDLLDQIFGEHDVEQDERYSPHMLGQHIQQIQPSLPSNDDTVFYQMQEDQSVEQIADVTNDQGSQPPTRRTSARRPSRRRSSFETQVESGFQRVIDTRQDILEELRSRKVQKLSYGDATAVLEKLPIEQLGVFWWAENKLLKNEVDVREAFIKWRIFLESLVGIDRYGNPCPHVDLLMTSQNLFQNVGMTGTSSMGTETVRTDFMGLLGMHSSELEDLLQQGR